MTTFGFFPCAAPVWQFASSSTPSVSHNSPLFALIAATPISRCAASHSKLVLALVEIRQLDRIEKILDLVFGEHLLLADDLEDALAALVRLSGQLARLLVADHRVQGGDDPDRGLHVVLELL